MKKSILAGILLTFATIFFCLGIFEISFPHIFAWSELLIDSFPKIYRYSIHIGVTEALLATLLMVFACFLDKILSMKVLETLSRLGLGGMFIFASLFKIQDPHNFAVLMAQYQFLPHDLINPMALMMPSAEFLVGIAIIITPFTKENSILLLFMFFSFIIALSHALFHDLAITCGCFALEGAQDKAETWTSLIRDLVLLIPTLWLITRKNQSLIQIWFPHKIK